MTHEFQRVAIVNRGEPAMRFIHAVRDYNLEHGTALRSIALFTDPDSRAMFVREADEAYGLGSAQVRDADTHVLKSSYVDFGRLERALISTHAEAVWVGWGFVAENPAFADLCRDMDIVFIGPDGRPRPTLFRRGSEPRPGRIPHTHTRRRAVEHRHHVRRRVGHRDQPTRLQGHR